MSRTDTTAPYWVRKDRGTPDYVRACGTGCTYCGAGKTRRRFDTHRTRQAAKRALRQNKWLYEY